MTSPPISPGFDSRVRWMLAAGWGIRGIRRDLCIAYSCLTLREIDRAIRAIAATGNIDPMVATAGSARQIRSVRKGEVKRYDTVSVETLGTATALLRAGWRRSAVGKELRRLHHVSPVVAEVAVGEAERLDRLSEKYSRNDDGHHEIGRVN